MQMLLTSKASCAASDMSPVTLLGFSSPLPYSTKVLRDWIAR